jgi:hypothetical protein
MKENMEFFKAQDAQADSSLVRLEKVPLVLSKRGGASRMVPQFKEWQQLPPLVTSTAPEPGEMESFYHL